MENIARFVQEERFKKILKETAGIGTPATRAGIIENAIKHNYIERSKKSLLATDKAFAVIPKLPAGMKSAGLTAAWEQELDKIAHNEETTGDFMQNIEKWVRSMITNYLSRSDFVISGVAPEGKSAAGGTRTSAGRSNIKSSAGTRKSTAVKSSVKSSSSVRKTQPAAVAPDSGAPACPNCGRPMILRTNKTKGNRFWGCSGFPQCRGTMPADE